MCFWESYICSNKLDVQETNFSFTQFNRIRNHLFGRWIEIGRDSRSRFMGSDCLVFGNTTQNHDRTGQPVVGRNTSHAPSQQSRRIFNVLNDVDRVPSNVQFSHQEASLYVFEDNEAVIKMIKKGTSPTLRHVSRTHGVALDWLFDQINLDPKIQIKYIDTKNPTC